MGVKYYMFPCTDIKVNREKQTLEGKIDGEHILYIHAILTDAINMMCDENLAFWAEVMEYELPEVKAKRKPKNTDGKF